MFTKRNVVFVAIIACALLVLTTPWNAIAGHDDSNVDINTAWSLDGAWMMRSVPDWGPVLEPVIFIAQDNVGQRYTMLMEDAECDFTLGGMFPTATDHSHLVGVCVRTGPYTFETTVVAFVVERGAGAPDKTLYQRVVTHTLRFVDANNIVASSSWAHYSPDQDADHGGFPDPGQAPFFCGHPETTMKRVVLVPPCEE